MTCKHLHKDAPEGSKCEDCHGEDLKTLKDMHFDAEYKVFGANNEFIEVDDKAIKEELRQEAIKWRKLHKTMKRNPDADWLLFFNITEEDLE